MADGGAPRSAEATGSTSITMRDEAEGSYTSTTGVVVVESAARGKYRGTEE